MAFIACGLSVSDMPSRACARCFLATRQPVSQE
jgi:hypothetical protein